MDDMQRYREIRDNADPEDPAKKMLASIAVSYDQAIAEAIRLERGGKTRALDRTLRKMDLIETADLLGDVIAEARGARDDYEQLKGINAELADERDALRQENARLRRRNDSLEEEVASFNRLYLTERQR